MVGRGGRAIYGQTALTFDTLCKRVVVVVTSWSAGSGSQNGHHIGKKNGSSIIGRLSDGRKARIISGKVSHMVGDFGDGVSCMLHLLVSSPAKKR
jgi:hypothetical protein